MEFRSSLLAAEGCWFTAKISADYGEELYSFSMDCQGDKTGAVTFEIMEPDALSGIAGNVSDERGTLTFEDAAICFPMLTDDQLSPAGAPWIFLKTLRSGYISSACMEDGKLRLTMDDSYEEDALRLDVWLDEDQHPHCADILYDGKRILSLQVNDFTFL